MTDLPLTSLADLSPLAEEAEPTDGERELHVGISGSYGGLNLGDEAILASIVAQLRAAGPIRITVLSRCAEDTRRRHEVDDAVDIRELTREESRALLGGLDLLIIGGGGILYDGECQLYLREAQLAREIGVPVMVYAISAGPLEEPRLRELVRACLGDAALVTVRDRKTMRLLDSVGIDRTIEVTADPALLLEPEALPPEALKREGLDDLGCLVGMSVREPGPAAPDISVEHYHGLLADAADFMICRFGAHIVFVPMERTDLQQSHAVLAKMRYPDRASILKGNYTSGQVLSLVDHLDFAVGMRLHFLIFAAHRRVPFVALPYAAKVESFVQEMGLDTPPLRAVNAGQLLAHIDRCWDERSLIRARIGETFPMLQARARRTGELARNLLATHRAVRG